MSADNMLTVVTKLHGTHLDLGLKQGEDGWIKGSKSSRNKTMNASAFDRRGIQGLYFSIDESSLIA